MDLAVRKLRLINRLTPAKIRKLIKEADSNLIKLLVEIVHNLEIENVALAKKDEKALSKFKKFLKALANLRTGLEAKRKLILRTRNSPKILKLILRSVKWLKGWH